MIGGCLDKILEVFSNLGKFYDSVTVREKTCFLLTTHMPRERTFQKHTASSCVIFHLFLNCFNRF